MGRVGVKSLDVLALPANLGEPWTDRPQASKILRTTNVAAPINDECSVQRRNLSVGTHLAYLIFSRGTTHSTAFLGEG